MINYVIYNDSGQILRSGSCPSEVSQIQNENEFQLNTDWPSDIHNYIVLNNELVRKSESETSEYQQNKDLKNFKSNRNLLLNSSDWTQVPDSPLTDAKKQEWATYRQQLRDLPSITTNFNNPPWPTPPE